ncbi:MAG: hypothetical protein GPJ54_14520 [Candidatus Heimdallarchaeota archaeon]|nr:hypothetical protein [Candidatus Heimdallarchaeota archaeon]
MKLQCYPKNVRNVVSILQLSNAPSVSKSIVSSAQVSNKVFVRPVCELFRKVNQIRDKWDRFQKISTII